MLLFLYKNQYLKSRNKNKQKISKILLKRYVVIFQEIMAFFYSTKNCLKQGIIPGSKIVPFYICYNTTKELLNRWSHLFKRYYKRKSQICINIFLLKMPALTRQAFLYGFLFCFLYGSLFRFIYCIRFHLFLCRSPPLSNPFYKKLIGG